MEGDAQNNPQNNHQSSTTSQKSNDGSGDHKYKLKTREERVTEGITLLKKLKEIGVGDYVAGINEVKEQIRIWINNGPAWSGKIDFPSYGRYADILLPIREGRVATLAFKVKK
jgi:hypothetical protein